MGNGRTFWGLGGVEREFERVESDRDVVEVVGLVDCRLWIPSDAGARLS